MSLLKRKSQTVPTLIAGVGLLTAFLSLASAADAVNQFIDPGNAVNAAEPLSPTNTTPPTLDAPPAALPTDTPLPAAPLPLPAAEPLPRVTEPKPDHAGILNAPRQFALGMIETGNRDEAIGGLGEVSRFQIMPSVWKHYNASRNYTDLAVSTEVARQHWLSLYEYFKKQTDREPTDFDLYVLWNTRHGYYANKGFDPGQLHPVVRDRAERFANLVQDRYRRDSLMAMAAAR